MRSSWVDRASMEHVLAAMMPTNRLVMRVCLVTGLRVSDVLLIRTNQLAYRFTVRESKTGKTRRITIPRQLLEELQHQAGSFYVFEGRNDPKKHRSRQAVYKDVKRCAAVFRHSGAVQKDAQVSPHSARKIAAVEAYQSGGLEAARKLLNHNEDDPAVTLLYALADEISKQPGKSGRKKRGTKNG